MIVVKRSGLILAGVVLTVAIILDQLALVRASAVSAVGCSASLFHARPDPLQLLALHRDAIVEQSALNNLPATLLAAVIVDHQRQLTSYREFTDCAGSALGANLSLGLGQLRISTASLLERKPLSKLSSQEFRNLRARLLDPALNIAMTARELRALLERPNRYPGMASSALLHDPAAMAVIVSEYRMGRMDAANADARLAINAFSTLDLMQDGTVSAFEREDEDQPGAREKIRNYLGFIFCESGMFNDSACKRWRRSLPETADQAPDTAVRQQI